MKICVQCKKGKLESEFYRDSSKKDGLYPSCKQCRKVKAKASYQENKLRILIDQKAYRQKNSEKLREASRNYREAHREYYQDYLRKYYLEHKDRWKEYEKTRDREKLLAYGRAYRVENREKVREGVRDWFRRNPQAAKKQSSNYRARLAEVKSTLTETQIQETLEYFDYRCAYCLVDLRTLPKGHNTIDHIIPLVRGGGNTQNNVVPCCKSCNSRKGPRSIVLMASYIGVERWQLPEAD